jgi:hypothetical protein
MVTEIDELQRRVDKIERQKSEEVLALVEILSNASFFGETKRSNCEYAKDGQCSFFVLDNKERQKIPIISQCRIIECHEPFIHHHIELSDISCTLCQRTVAEPGIDVSKQTSKKPKNNSQNNEDITRIKINEARKQK